MLCYEQELDTPITTQRSFRFSLQVHVKEGFSVTGDIAMIQEHRPTILRANRQRPVQADNEYDDRDADVKQLRSAVRVNRQTEPIPHVSTHHRSTNSIWRRVLLIVLLCLGIFFIADTAGYAAWTTISQRLQYGDYPTTQMDVNLGHGGISHLTAYTVGNQIILTEQVGNKLTPYAIKANVPLKPPRVVSIQIVDVNLDGKPDVLLHVDGLAQSIIFDNTGTGLVLGVAH